MDDEVGGVAPISDEQIEKLELSFGYSDDDYESLVNAFRNAWPSIICRLRSQSAEIAELRRRHSAQIGLTCEMSVEADRLRAELAEAKREAIADHERNVNLGIEIEALRADLERVRADTVREILVDLRAYCHLEAHKLIYDKYRGRNDG